MSASAAQKVFLAVGSKNPVKLNASLQGARKALSELEVVGEGFNVPSGIPEQPFGDEQTKLGAVNRAKSAFEAYKSEKNETPTYSLGLEGGVLVNKENVLECFAWIVVYDGKKFGHARTGSFELPEGVRRLVVDEGMELGPADDKLFGTSNSKQKGGSVGQLTRGAVDRTLYYEQAVVLAFIPFLWPELY